MGNQKIFHKNSTIFFLWNDAKQQIKSGDNILFFKIILMVVVVVTMFCLLVWQGKWTGEYWGRWTIGNFRNSSILLLVIFTLIPHWKYLLHLVKTYSTILWSLTHISLISIFNKLVYLAFIYKDNGSSKQQYTNIVIIVLYYFTVKCDYQISCNCGISIFKSLRTLWGRSWWLMSDRNIRNKQ